MLGCPIRKCRDITLVCSSPCLIAAYHVLRRLSMPRHPPCALNCFKKFEIAVVLPLPTFNLCSRFYNLFTQYVKELFLFPGLADVQVTNLQALRQHLKLTFKRTTGNSSTTGKCGGERSRTDDPLLAKQVL
jgi:hypothetical protein